MESLGIEHPSRSGFHEELDDLAQQAEIDRSVILLYYRAPDRFHELVAEEVSEDEARELVRDEIRAYNAWGLAVARANPRLVPFIGVNARFMSPAQIRTEILDAAANGAKGVKITPGSMRAYADDPILEPIFEACVEARLPLLSQSGRGSGAGPSPGSDPWGHPGYWFDPLARHPELTVILAHMAHGFEDTLSDLLEVRPNACTDTSMRLSGLGKPDRPTAQDLVATIRRLGVDRVLFGTNYPFVNPVVYAEVFASLPLGPDERDAIAHGNYERVVNG
jgi:predicted TIM-barrel fold metal-dependent hydrolase